MIKYLLFVLVLLSPYCHAQSCMYPAPDSLVVPAECSFTGKEFALYDRDRIVIYKVLYDLNGKKKCLDFIADGLVGIRNTRLAEIDSIWKEVKMNPIWYISTDSNQIGEQRISLGDGWYTSLKLFDKYLQKPYLIKKVSE